MPKETFFNLKEQKRNTILSNAFREFALHDYAHASLSRIVEDSGIAKGSMYQYFEGKKELFFYILDQAVEKKLSYISRYIDTAFDEESASFFEKHKRIVLLGTYFDFSYPHYSLVLINAINGPFIPELGDLSRELKDRSENYIREFVQYAVSTGEIRDDLDVGLIVHSINRLTLSLGEYVEKRYNCSLVDLLSAPSSEPPFLLKDLEEIIDQLLSVIRCGIERREEQGND